jgi:hypothetical protein
MSKRPEHGEPHTERHEHHIYQEKSRAEWTLEVLIALMVLGTLGATSIAAYWTSWQWQTASDQVGIMQDTEQRQLRAYVGVVPGDVENFGIPDEMHLKILRKNYGTTPAYDVGFSVVGYAISDPNQIAIGGSYGVQGCAKAPKTELITMFPGTELPWTVNINGNAFTSEQVDNVRNGKTVFAFYGNICYLDAWLKPHYTDYCWFYKGADMSSKTADGCLIHNGSD